MSPDGAEERKIIFMKLYIDGDIGRYYVQTLCLIFFPGAKFPENEAAGPETDVVSLKLETGAEFYKAYADIYSGGRHSSAAAFEPRGGIDTDDRVKKRAVGKAVYEAGAELFAARPEWGILTGVRPAKLADELMSKAARALNRECGDFGVRSSCSETGVFPEYLDVRNAVEEILVRDYCTSAEKARLLTDVAKNEKSLIQSVEKDTCSLYISIPFCPTRCAYCSFVSYSTEKLLTLVPDYTERLCRDIEYVGNLIKSVGQKVSTVYIGGGTPTILEVRDLTRILEAVEKNIDLSGVREFTVEAGRPDTITADKLSTLRCGGVSRISINPQTTNNEILHKIGRLHTAEDFLRAYEMADRIGFSCINTDLIAGLPGESADSFRRSFDTILELEPENITVHTFCVKKAADFAEQKSLYSRSDKDTGESISYSQKRSAQADYIPYYMYKQKNAVGGYENVGFSKKGCEGIYNILIMDEVHSIFAAGAGAVTKLVSKDRKNIERIFTPKYPYEYLKCELSDGKETYYNKVMRFYTEVYDARKISS